MRWFYSSLFSVPICILQWWLICGKVEVTWNYLWYCCFCLLSMGIFWVVTLQLTRLLLVCVSQILRRPKSILVLKYFVYLFTLYRRRWLQFKQAKVFQLFSKNLKTVFICICIVDNVSDIHAPMICSSLLTTLVKRSCTV